MRSDVEQLQPQATTPSTVDEIVQNIETYFYVPRLYHWEYHYDDGYSINVYGVNVVSGAVLNVNWQYYERFKKDFRAIGYCVAETAFVEAWLKSVGIASDSITRHPLLGGYLGHIHAIYYDPVAKVWKGYYEQVRLGIADHPTDVQEFKIRMLPLDYVVDSYHEMHLTLPQIQAMLVQNGVTSDQMQLWTLPS
jgi:hypothetical protein